MTDTIRPPKFPNVTVITHPLVQHKLTLLREKERSTSSFRTLLAELSMLLVYEVTRDLPLVYKEIETPLAAMRAPLIDGKKVVLLNILRAGTGMLRWLIPPELLVDADPSPEHSSGEG